MIPDGHIDGTPCPEGTQRLPPGDAPLCCEAFRARTFACYFDIRYEYWPDNAGWFVIITPDAGGGGIAINFCPHCGAKLAGEGHAGRYFDLSGFEAE
jgi:hypothetical protein